MVVIIKYPENYEFTLNDPIIASDLNFLELYTVNSRSSSKSSAGDAWKLKKNVSFQKGEFVDFFTRVCFTWL